MTHIDQILEERTRYIEASKKVLRNMIRIDHLLGETMKAERGKISLRAVAEKAGISAPYLSDIERGRRAPPRSTLEKLLVAIKHLKNP